MVTVKYSAMRVHSFNAGLSKLLNYPRFTPSVALSVVRLIERVEKEREVAQKLYEGIIKKYAKLDDKGELLPKDGQPNSFVLREDATQEQIDKEVEEMGEQTFSIDMRPIALPALEGVGLTPQELMYMASLVDENPAGLVMPNEVGGVLPFAGKSGINPGH